MARAYKTNAVNQSAANFYSTNVDFRRQSAQSMTKMMRTGSTFKYSQNHYRKSFFDQIPGANENRFIAFNDMPYNSSKYALNSQLTRATTDFSKQCNRDNAVMIGSRDPSASVYLGYDVKQFDIQQAIERNLRNSSKKLLNMNESRKMINVR